MLFVTILCSCVCRELVHIFKKQRSSVGIILQLLLFLIICLSASHQCKLLFLLVHSLQECIHMKLWPSSLCVALTYRNDEEEKALSLFLNLSRFPQVMYEIFLFVCQQMNMIMKNIIPCSSKTFSVSADIAPSGFAFRDHGTVTLFCASST